MKQPRDYQTWTHNATMNFIMDPANWKGGAATEGYGPKYPLVVAATGLGKSMNIAMFIMDMLFNYGKGARILQLCHVKELVESNYLELMGMWPTAPAGVYAASMKQRDTGSQVIFAMINSVAKRAASFGRVDFVLIDEAHRLSDNDKALYSKFLEALREVNPNLIVIGYTATDYRMKGGKLTEMGLFDEVVYDIGSGDSFVWAVEQGYLVMPVPTDPGFQLDDSGVKVSGGEYKTSDASAAMHDQNLIERAVDYSIKIAREEGHKSSISFGQSAEDCDLIADMFSYKGFPMEAVHTKMDGDRDDILERHKRGELWGVASRDILTTGWNNPLVSLMINLRLTRSPGLWVQMVGRMTRPLWVNHFYGPTGGPTIDDEGRWNIGTLEGRLGSINQSGKLFSRVLDFCGNTERLGPINYPFIPNKRKKGGGEAPVRKCDGTTEEGQAAGMGCNPVTIHHTSVRVCPHCGYEWPKSYNLDIKASTSELVSKVNPLGLPEVKKKPKEYEVFSVHEIVCTHHHGKVIKRASDGEVLESKPNTMRVDYRCGHRKFPRWICIEHPKGSWAKNKANEWWEDHSGEKPCPDSIEEAIERVEELIKPKFVKVWINTNCPEIVAYDFIGHRFEEVALDLSNPRKKRELHEPEEDPLEKEREQAFKSASYGSYSGTGDYDYDDDIPF